MTQRAKRAGPAPQQRRRPDTPRSGFWGWLDRGTLWFGVAVLVLSLIVLGLPAARYAREVLFGGQTSWQAVLGLVALFAGETVIVFMILLSTYAAVPQRVPLEPPTVRLLGILVFVGMFFLLLLVLRGEIFAAAPMIVYFLVIRRSLAYELPVFAGGRLPPERREDRRDNVVRRPPRSWDGPDGGKASQSASGRAGGTAGRRRGKKTRRSVRAGNRPRGR